MTFTGLSFTPSEYMLLNGEKFVPESTGANKLPLLCSDILVDGQALALLICVAAILVNENENGLTLNLKTTHKVFGLKESTHLILRPTGKLVNWNGYTLESAFLFIASQAYAVPGDYSVQNIVYSILDEDRDQPWMKIIELVETGLASSNWLMPVSGEAAAAFSTPYICPAKVRDLAIAQSAEPLLSLLTECKKNRSEIWHQLTTEITQAFNDRKK